MGFLRDHIVFLFEHLPPWMQDVWAPKKQNEHEIIFPNGSRIQSLTSHPEVLRSNSASLNIIDEAAFIQGMDTMWAAGWPCSRGDTLIQTKDGLIKIEDIAAGGDPWKDIDLMVATDDGFKHSNKGYVSGKKPTTIINTYLGFEFEGADHHQVRIINDNGDYVWSRLDSIKPGDTIVSVPGQYVGARRKLSNDIKLDEQLAEIIGLYIAESGGTTENLRLNSAEFSQFMVANGLNSKTCPQDAQIPSLILKSDEPVLCAFLKGLFDSDGWCYQSATNLKLGFSTTSLKLAEQVQICLHALGIISRRNYVDNIESKNEDRYSKDPYWRVEIWDAHSKLVYRQKIGFITQRKQKCLDSFKGSNEYSDIANVNLVREFALAAKKALLNDGSFRNCKDSRKWNIYKIAREGRVRLSVVRELSEEFDLQCRLSEYVRKGYYFDIVTEIRNGEEDLYDISVPGNNTYLANGIVSHNTLQHGGNAIIISTTNGIGNWYWSTWTDAVAGVNGFNPINVDWWDMDWAIEYKDAISAEWKRIAPCDDIRKCTDSKEISKYGPYWSPWLEVQYNALQQQGDGWKFEQEVLASFIGSGNTVLSKDALSHVQTTIKEPIQRVAGYQTYVHPVSGEVEDINFDFDDAEQGLWIWKKPVAAQPIKRKGNEVIHPGSSAHSYVMGVDIATGKGRDFSTIEIFDIDEMEQVAEFMARCLPRELVKYIDRIGRLYNCALAVVERNNGGDTLIDSLRYDVMYPRIWRKKDINDKPRISDGGQRSLKVSQYGFSTSLASKPTLNKYLIDYISATEGEGYKIYSARLLKQLQIYVRKRDRTGRDTNKTEAEDGAGNFDDLVIATALSLVGASDAFVVDSSNLLPTGSANDFSPGINDRIAQGKEKHFIEQGGQTLLMPVILPPDEIPDVSRQRYLDEYTIQLGGIPVNTGGPIVIPNKEYFKGK